MSEHAKHPAENSIEHPEPVEGCDPAQTPAILRRAQDEVLRRAQDEVLRRAQDEVLRRAQDEVLRQAQDEVLRQAQDDWTAGNGLLNAALDYAGRGWYVFPCRLDKTPATQHGVKDATIDPVQVRRWWTDRPGASIGVACGPSGLVVIDIDVAKGGLASWQRLKAAHGIDDETLTSLTGGGGWHLIYRAPERFQGRNSAGKLGPGVDVRANGGYIIAPPSGHPSGREYIWDPARFDLEPILLPDSLRTLLERPAPEARAAAPVIKLDPAGAHWAAAALSAEVAALRRATEGTRNDRLNAAAFKLGRLTVGHDLGRAAVEQALLLTARADRPGRPRGPGHDQERAGRRSRVSRRLTSLLRGWPATARPRRTSSSRW